MFTQRAPPRMEVPWRQVALLCGFVASFYGLQIGKAFTRTCSWQWGALMGASALLCLALPLALCWRARRQQQQQQSQPKQQQRVGGDGCAAAEPEAGSDAWSARMMGLALLITFAAGLLGGLLGIGGGMLVAPLLLGA